MHCASAAAAASHHRRRLRPPASRSFQSHYGKSHVVASYFRNRFSVTLRAGSCHHGAGASQRRSCPARKSGSYIPLLRFNIAAAGGPRRRHERRRSLPPCIYLRYRQGAPPQALQHNRLGHVLPPPRAPVRRAGVLPPLTTPPLFRFKHRSCAGTISLISTAPSPTLRTVPSRTSEAR